MTKGSLRRQLKGKRCSSLVGDMLKHMSKKDNRRLSKLGALAQSVDNTLQDEENDSNMDNSDV